MATHLEAHDLGHVALAAPPAATGRVLRPILARHGQALLLVLLELDVLGVEEAVELLLCEGWTESGRQYVPIGDDGHSLGIIAV
jgi:hypothetical protein